MARSIKDRLKIFEQVPSQHDVRLAPEVRKPTPRSLKRIEFFEGKIQENVSLTDVEKLEQQVRNEARERNQQRRLEQIKVLKENEETQQVSLLTINSFNGEKILPNPQRAINLSDILFKICNLIPEKISIGCGWITETDLDLSLVCLNSNLERITHVDFRQLKGFGDTIIHHGDNLVGSNSDSEDAETIDINLKNLPQEVKTLALLLISYKGLQFHQIKKSWMSLNVPVSKKVVLYLDIKTSEDCTSLLFATLHRNEFNEWFYVPINKFFNSTRQDEAYNFTINFLKADDFLKLKMVKSQILTV
jgi:stress response protein SCP2